MNHMDCTTAPLELKASRYIHFSFDLLDFVLHLDWQREGDEFMGGDGICWLRYFSVRIQFSTPSLIALTESIDIELEFHPEIQFATSDLNCHTGLRAMCSTTDAEEIIESVTQKNYQMDYTNDGIS
jgi:hypothetical protein